MTIVEQLESLNSEFLTELVRSSTGKAAAQVRDWSFSLLHGGFSEAVGVFRVQGHASEHETIFSWSLILKVLTPEGQSNDPKAWNYWRREIELYESGFLQDLPAKLRGPGWISTTVQPNGSVWLWLEDVFPVKEGSWSLDDYRRLAYQLGVLNGKYIHPESHSDNPILSRNWLSGWLEENGAAIEQLRQSLELPQIRRVFPQNVAVELLSLWDERQVFMDTLARLPQTICHLDVVPRNILFRQPLEGEPESVALDWAFAGHAALGEELVPLIVGSVVFFDVALSEAEVLEEAVFASYIGGLGASGWRGDPQVVRLGYATAGAFRYTLGALRLFLPALLNESLQPFFEQLFRQPFANQVECIAFVAKHFSLQLAAEARKLRHLG